MRNSAVGDNRSQSNYAKPRGSVPQPGNTFQHSYKTIVGSKMLERVACMFDAFVQHFLLEECFDFSQDAALYNL